MLLAPIFSVSETSSHTVELFAFGCKLESFKADLTQTVIHSLNKANVLMPDENCITLIGKDPSQRYVVLRQIEPCNYDITLKELCDDATFSVHVLQISPHQKNSPIANDPSVVTVHALQISPHQKNSPITNDPGVVTVSDSDDEMAAGVPLPKTPTVINVKKFVTQLAPTQHPLPISPPNSPQAARVLSPPRSPKSPLQYSYSVPLSPAPWLDRSRLPSPKLGAPWPTPLSSSQQIRLTSTSPPPKSPSTQDCRGGCGFAGSHQELFDHESTCVACGVPPIDVFGVPPLNVFQRDKKHVSASPSPPRDANKSKSRSAKPGQHRNSSKPGGVKKGRACAIKSKPSAKADRIKKRKSSAGSSRSVTSKALTQQRRLKLEERERVQKFRWEMQAIKLEQKRIKQEKQKQKQERKKLTQKILADSKASLLAVQQHTSKYWTLDAPLYGPVVRDSAEWQEVELEFRNSFSREKNVSDWQVHEINRIQNLDKITTFQAQRLLIAKDKHKPAMQTRSYEYPNDLRNLWHGTKKEAVEPIINHGFDRSAMSSNGAMLGVGTYFSTDVDLPLTGECGNPHRYTPLDKDGCKHLILTEVIMGNSVIGDPDYKIFPIGVHSTVDDLKEPEKVCVHHDNNTHAIYHLVLKNVKKK